MKPRLTRRALTKILLATPVVIASGPIACQTTSGGRSGSQRLSGAEQKDRADLSREVSHLQKGLERLGQMEIPIGSEPAIHFAPLLPKK
jgi:hypothetical protein